MNTTCQGQPGLHSEFKSSLGYIVRLYLKKQMTVSNDHFFHVHMDSDKDIKFPVSETDP